MHKPSLILETEDAAAYTTLFESLAAEYQPETQGQQITIGEAARAIWELARANREFDKSQHALYQAQPHMRDWNPAQQAEFERMFRYRTHAELAHGRALKAVEYLRKLRLQAEQCAFRENLQQELLALAKQRLQLAEARIRTTLAPKIIPEPKPPERPPIRWPDPILSICQLIRISLEGGTQLVELYPANQEMLRQAKLAKPATQVLRRFSFPHGVPAEYAWVSGPGLRRKGLVWEQYFETLEAWRSHLAREAPGGPEHFLPVPQPPSATPLCTNPP